MDLDTILCRSLKQHNKHTNHIYRQTSSRIGGNSKNNIIIVVMLVMLVLGVPETVVGECPHLCECKWKSGKESVVCLNANLSGIPAKLDAGTQILDLTRNDIGVVANDAFDRVNLLNLQKLFMAKCRLRTIERYAFRNLINLVELDLSDNAMVSVPSHAFDATPELRELRLNGNPIQRIYNDAFVRVPQLMRLELSDCKLVTIDVRAFVGLESSLEWLKLDGNRLTDVRAGALMRLQNLHGLELAGNPWNCSCILRPLREWMLRENIPFDIPPVCRFPERLHAKSWDKIDLDEYACIPHILAPDIRAHGVEGRNITMSCMVGGVPEPNVRWIVRNRVIANLTGNTMLPTTQGRKVYVANLQQNASNLTILTAEVQDAGTYICAAENKAGKVEASVTLAVSRKPAEAMMSAKVILASVIAVALFVLTASLAVVCVCTLRRRKKLMRWHPQSGRCESYEKIELNNCKPNHRVKSPRSRGGGGVGGVDGGLIVDRSALAVPSFSHKNESLAIEKTHFNGKRLIPMAKVTASAAASSAVGQTFRRNGDYRNVPSEDDGTGYEDNIETSNATISNIKIESVMNRWPSDKLNLKIEKSPKSKHDETDLHIPRLIEFSDSTPDSGCNSSMGQYDIPKRPITSLSAATTSGGGSGSGGYTKPTWSHHINRKRLVPNMELKFSGVGKDRMSDSRTTSESDCESDKKYPDLLDISSLSTTTKSNSNHANMLHTSAGASAAAAATSFCTFPRKKHSMAATRQCVKKSTQSDSQSPLLPDSSSSRYSSSTFTENDFIMGRRLSSDSFTNYPLSIYSRMGMGGGASGAMGGFVDGIASNHPNGRSNSFLNLVSPTANGSVSHHKRNPSLPSSPAKDAPKMFSPAETPLLDFTTLTSRKQQLIATPSPSTSSTTANAYDYHAAQLERFLEEYRNLQEQLCKMKETCDSIRKKEAPLRGTAGNSAKLADPVMYTAAALPTPLPMTDAAIATNPKSILKNKTLLPGQPPDPPPYWLHRNAMLKRLHDPGTDFFQS